MSALFVCRLSLSASRLSAVFVCRLSLSASLRSPVDLAATDCGAIQRFSLRLALCCDCLCSARFRFSVVHVASVIPARPIPPGEATCEVSHGTCIAKKNNRKIIPAKNPNNGGGGVSWMRRLCIYFLLFFTFFYFLLFETCPKHCYF